MDTPKEIIAALFVPIEEKWIESAMDFFKKGNRKLYYSTNANIASIVKHAPKHIYFKISGNTEVKFIADFIDLVPGKLPPQYYQYTLEGKDILHDYKFSYGFSNLCRLKEFVQVADLKYFTNGNNLRNDVPGARIIIDPFPGFSPAII